MPNDPTVKSTRFTYLNLDNKHPNTAIEHGHNGIGDEQDANCNRRANRRANRWKLYKVTFIIFLFLVVSAFPVCCFISALNNTEGDPGKEWGTVVVSLIFSLPLLIFLIAAGLDFLGEDLREEIDPYKPATSALEVTDATWPWDRTQGLVQDVTRHSRNVTQSHTWTSGHALTADIQFDVNDNARRVAERAYHLSQLHAKNGDRPEGDSPTVKAAQEIHQDTAEHLEVAVQALERHVDALGVFAEHVNQLDQEFDALETLTSAVDVNSEVVAPADLIEQAEKGSFSEHTRRSLEAISDLTDLLRADKIALEADLEHTL